MLCTCERGADVRFGRMTMLPSTSVARCNKFVQRYHPSLFCKFNHKDGLLEIWDTGKRNFKYMVKVLKTKDGKFREPDYRDLADFYERSYERRGRKWLLIDEIERKDEEWETWQNEKQRHENYNISMEQFNKVMSNPVIGGQ